MLVHHPHHVHPHVVVHPHLLLHVHVHGINDRVIRVDQVLRDVRLTVQSVHVTILIQLLLQLLLLLM